MALPTRTVRKLRGDYSDINIIRKHGAARRRAQQVHTKDLPTKILVGLSPKHCQKAPS